MDTNSCHLCSSLNIVNKHCLRCKKPYCAEDASKLDPGKYCDECMRDVVIEETTFTRSDEEFSVKANATYINTTSCKQIKFDGLDWMFGQQQINFLSDEELLPILDYHKAYVLRIESEIVNRKIKRAHEQVQIEHPAAKKIISAVKTVRTSVTKQAKSAAPVLSMEMLADLMVRLGMTSSSELQEYLAKQKKVQ